MYQASPQKSSYRRASLKSSPPPDTPTTRLKKDSKLPSGSFSVQKRGTELSLCPSSPHRYTLSYISNSTNSPDDLRHMRSSTVSPQSFKFIAATEFISNEEQLQAADPEVFSDEFVENLSLAKEPKHSLVYISPGSNRNSLIASTADPIAISVPSTPQVDTFNCGNRRFYGLKTIEPQEKFSNATKVSNNSYDEQKILEEFNIIAGRIYCDRCEDNVSTVVEVRNPRKSM